jgi:hypothetical protein
MSNVGSLLRVHQDDIKLSVVICKLSPAISAAETHHIDSLQCDIGWGRLGVVVGQCNRVTNESRRFLFREICYLPSLLHNIVVFKLAIKAYIPSSPDSILRTPLATRRQSRSDYLLPGRLRPQLLRTADAFAWAFIGVRDWYGVRIKFRNQAAYSRCTDVYIRYTQHLSGRGSHPLRRYAYFCILRYGYPSENMLMLDNQQLAWRKGCTLSHTRIFLSDVASKVRSICVFHRGVDIFGVYLDQSASLISRTFPLLQLEDLYVQERGETTPSESACFTRSIRWRLEQAKSTTPEVTGKRAVDCSCETDVQILSKPLSVSSLDYFVES